ncbi:HEAT repeat domain-containing protein [Vreelandella lutescens]|uniref:Pellicle/biofilm biosynthesis protein PelE n=1 Tax=Vreelandella lutescens TaxID=1602943 RepID=A0ABQ1P5G6_9GAMM|nr:HEAT repeat domain-containing protein [Halomonas lutescens]GGC90668.1 pellicle/biofilm biosynthesis protein PelE [Halomonas lutescens]
MPRPNPAQPGGRHYAISLCWLAAGLGVEAWAVHRWIASPGVPSLTDIAMHAAGSVLLAEGLRRALPLNYQQPVLGSLLVLFLLLFLLPGIALIGLLLAVVPALYLAAPARIRAWQTLDLPSLPYRPLTPPSADSIAMREGLTSVLSFSESPMARQEAILACRHLPPRQAIGLLRLGLADPTDDVRLLAYSMLSGFERELDERIQRLTATRDQHGDPYGHHAEALAMLNWEYDYLHLAQGSTAHFYLTQALTEIDTAIRRANSAHRQLLRGRLCLALKAFDSAEAAFTQCALLGMHDDDLAAYRAELAFQTRRYDDMREQLARLSPSAAQHPVLHPLMEYWR